MAAGQGTCLESGLHQLLGLRQLLQEAVADDEAVPQLLLLKYGHGGPHQPRAH